MPRARKHQVSLDITPYYHCISRCVRRSFLCGFDAFSGKSYEHRRQWVEDRLLFLATVFAIDVCAYAVMSNHLHVVLHINKLDESRWSDKDICERWHRIFKGTPLTQKFVRNEPLTIVELEAVKLKVTQWRSNLCSISWFMRTLNEPIARQANAEDQCTGRFWEGRFKSQALCDEAALIACMAYVDLNPIRAKLAKSPDQSEHTSVKKRIKIFAQTGEQPTGLAKFTGNQKVAFSQGLRFNLKDYIELMEWTGKAIRDDKRGAIDKTLPPAIDRLNIEAEQWLTLTTKFERHFKSIVGSTEKLRQAAEKLGFKRTPNIKNCKIAFG